MATARPQRNADTDTWMDAAEYMRTLDRMQEEALLSLQREILLNIKFDDDALEEPANTSPYGH